MTQQNWNIGDFKGEMKNGMDPGFHQPALLTMSCLLLTRIGDEKSATREAFKDEMDVYLSSLMAAFKNPARVEHLKPYLAEYDIDIFRRLENATDARVKYLVFKTADDMLVTSVGLFQSEDADSCPRDPEYTNGKQGQMGKGETHFRFAFTYTHRVTCPEETIAEVLKELTMGLDKYATIVSYLDGERFNIGKRLAGAEVYILDRLVEESLKLRRIKRKQDEFLDAYLRWKRNSSDDLRAELDALAAELRELDPNFTFDPT